MVIGLIYNLKGTLPHTQGVPRDLEAEYQDQEELDALEEAMRLNGWDTVRLPCDPELAQRIGQVDIDMAFNVAEGWGGRGRESFVPALLDMLGIPCTGSDALSLGISLDKALTKGMALSHGIPTPSYVKVNSLEDLGEISLSFPLFVKPNGEGSSMGIGEGALVRDFAQLQCAVHPILRHYQGSALVEEFLEGREFTVGLLGNGRDVQTFPVLEIVLPEGVGYYPFEKKRAHARTLRCPAELSEGLSEELKRMAITVYCALECRDFARVDFRADRRGWPHFLEINPLPGLHPRHSLFPYQAYAAGLSYPELIGGILMAARTRWDSLNAE
jgi:D-alanine-D-alanine ligase